MNKKVLLSTLWIFAVLNYLYADVFNLFFVPGVQEEARAFTGGSQAPVLIFAVLMETAISMALLSRVLPYRANRRANVAFGAVHTALVAWSLFPEATLFYGFFAAVEIITTLFIIWTAWKWSEPV